MFFFAFSGAEEYAAPSFPALRRIQLCPMTVLGSVPTLLRETWTTSPGLTVKLVMLSFMESCPESSIEVVAAWAPRDVVHNSAKARLRGNPLVFMVVLSWVTS